MGIICDYIVLLFILENKLAFGQNFYLMKYAGQRLEVTYNTMEAGSPIHCNAICKRESSCHAVNYNTITGECQPSETSYADVAGNTVTDPDWDVYTLTACLTPDPISGVHIPGGETSYGSNLIMQCDTGYQPVNSAISTATITCQASASWSIPDDAFSCLRVCGEPPEQDNSHVLPGYNTVYSQRQYQCDEQYVLTAASDASSMTITCQASGNWTSTSFQCIIDCLTPDPITGVDIPNGETTYGSSLTIQCQTGYQPENSAVSTATITCLPSGVWSTPDDVFNCLKDCGEPSQQDNSHVLPGTNTVYSERQYQCDEQYVLTAASDASSMTVTCQASGFWTSTSFQCVIDCEAPDPIAGVVIPSGETSYGSSLTIQCATGYQPENSAVSTATITCLASGSWSTPDAAFSCLRVCEEPPGQDNSHVLPGYNTVYSQRQYQCDEQYVLTAASDASSMTITCQASGNWTSTNFQCVIDCEAPDPITGVDIPSGETIYGSSLTIQCQTGYQPENSEVSTATITCLPSGSWSTPDDVFHCLRVCEEPPQQDNSHVLPGTNTVYSQRQYQCDAQYVLTAASDASSMTVTCQTSGNWTPTSFQCVIDCGSPSALANGAWSGTTYEGSVVTYTCDSRYSPSPTGADTTIICQASGAWTTPLISCQVASIGMSCSSDSDCLEVNSRCLYNNYDSAPRWRCLCNYKTEYNEASRSCDTQCTTYSDTFTQYEDIYIGRYNHVHYYNKTTDECLQACIDYGETCASVDYSMLNPLIPKCYIGSASYQQIYDGDPSQIIDWHYYDLYTRDCYN